MKRLVYSLLSGTLLLGAASCRTSYKVSDIQAKYIVIDSTFDNRPDAEAVALITKYKSHVDSIMNGQIGVMGMSMDRFAPESPLSNLIADVLRGSATTVIGKPADVAVINLGGIRGSLTEGPLTTAQVYEILPFENALCILTMKGSTLKQLFENIAVRGGEGLSGARLVIADRKLVEATVAGKEVDDNAIYTVATVDYLAEGNDGMKAFLQAESRLSPENSLMRDIFMDYVKKMTAEGKSITAPEGGRVLLKTME